MAGSWVDDCVPVQTVFGRSGNVAAAAGDYSAAQVSFDTGLQIATPGNVALAIDSLFDASPVGDKALRVTSDDFQSGLILSGSTPSIITPGNSAASGLSQVALSTGAWEFTGASGVDILREAPPSNTTFSGLWTIRSTGSAQGRIDSRAALFPTANKRLRFACRLQALPVAQRVSIGFYDTSSQNYALVQFHTLSSSVFSIQWANSKASTALSSALPFSTTNEALEVVFTLDNYGARQRVAIYGAAGNLIGPISEYTVPAANIPLQTTSMRAGIYTDSISLSANTPCVRVDYCELGLML